MQLLDSIEISLWQSSESVGDPQQGCPALWTLDRSLVPTPQVSEQSDQLVQLSQDPSTVKKIVHLRLCRFMVQC